MEPAVAAVGDPYLELQDVLQSNHLFTSDLYQVLSGTEGNIFFSPLSIQLVLLMLYVGARDKTAKALSSSLHLPGDTTSFLEKSKFFTEQLNHASQLTLASEIFAEKNYKIKEGYKTNLRKYFAAELHSADFATEPEVSRQIINKWVADKTANKITEILSPDSVDRLTRMVLVNTIHFKGQWFEEFKKNETVAKPFYVSKEKTVSVNMMRKRGRRYSFLDTTDYQVILLPYKNGNFSMLIFLPKEKDGLAKLEKCLKFVSIPATLDIMYTLEVYVEIPKFKLEQFIDLNEPLTKLGMGIIFSSVDANLTEIADDNLYVSKALHKSFLEVNEEGTEAAAVTAGSVAVLTSFVPAPAQFVANHPFVFYILHNDAILFMGRFVKP